MTDMLVEPGVALAHLRALIRSGGHVFGREITADHGELVVRFQGSALPAATFHIHGTEWPAIAAELDRAGKLE